MEILQRSFQKDCCKLLGVCDFDLYSYKQECQAQSSFAGPCRALGKLEKDSFSSKVEILTSALPTSGVRRSLAVGQGRRGSVPGPVVTVSILGSIPLQSWTKTCLHASPFLNRLIWLFLSV